jgi:transposase
VDALGNPVQFILTAGQVHDIRQAKDLITGLCFENLLADMGYDSDGFRAQIADAGAQAVIPSSRARSQSIPYDKHLYEERNLVERLINTDQAFSPHRDALRENCALVCIRAIPGRRHDLAQVNVNRT